MKKAAVILLLLSFAARPAFELGYLAYFELNIDYIIETYCVNRDKPQLKCNGQCYLMEQLALAGSTEDDSKSMTLVEIFYPVFFQDYEYSYQVFLPRDVLREDAYRPTQLSLRSAKVPVPPPEI